jgi:hypothetical protein
MKGKKNEATTYKALTATTLQSSTKILIKKDPQIKLLMRPVFGTLSFEEGNKSPSLEQNVEAAAATTIERIIEALEP